MALHEIANLRRFKSCLWVRIPPPPPLLSVVATFPIFPVELWESRIPQL